MAKSIDDLFKEIVKIQKENKSFNDQCAKDYADLKKQIRFLIKKTEEIALKIQEFEIIMDAAEMLEEHIQDEEEKYNTEWNPYDDEYGGEDYDSYDNDIEEDQS